MNTTNKSIPRKGNAMKSKSVKPATTTKAKHPGSCDLRRPVLVTTAHRGVFFGYAAETNGETIAMTKARLCLYWSHDVKGFMGLASTGPNANCRVGPAADIALRNITAVLEVTPEAVKAWEAAPWRD